VLALDRALELPVTVSATNARSLLAASFGALVTAGAFAFWMLPVAAQLAASSVPSPAVAGHLQDPFQRRVIGATLGALSYTAVTVLALPPAPDTAAPTVATVVGGGLGVAAIAGLLVAIQHAVRSTRPTSLISEAAEEVLSRIRRSNDRTSAAVRRPEAPGDRPRRTGAGLGADVAVLAPATGWLAAVDEDAVLDAVPPRSTVALDVGVGSFVVRGWTRIATVHGPEVETSSPLGEQIARHLTIADDRPTDRDLAGAITRFADIAVHAGTGGSSAPSTVYEALWYLGAILHELVGHEPASDERERHDGRSLERAPEPGAAALAETAVDRIRQVIAWQPVMAVELVRILVDARRHAGAAGRHDLVAVLDEQADLTVAACRHADPLAADLERVVAARDEVQRGDGTERAEEYPTDPSEPNPDG
ncbi:MAG: DUF2254 family protein, partial [Acidimicrobiia bacterium]